MAVGLSSQCYDWRRVMVFAALRFKEIALDPTKAFDRLERSGGGFIVPFILFCIGLLITVAACLAIRQVDERIDKQNREQETAQQDTLVEFIGVNVHVDA